ncbi:MAG: heparinase II/III family protein [Phycisphaerales bacterium]|nr:MAG: heparinase II/III family protein [Phycisphaerales bacterium]
MSKHISVLVISCLVLAASRADQSNIVASAAASAQLATSAGPDWTGKIRSDHPRLFFNAETWPAVRHRALGAERSWYLNFKRRVDQLMSEQGESTEPRELGPQAAWAAFVFRVTQDTKYLELAKKCLEASLSYYETCFEQAKSVNWYSTSRVHATLAWDWLYNDLSVGERGEYMSRLVRVIDNVLKARPSIYRENMSGYSTGFYGVRNCLWFIGCTAFGTGIEPERVNEWLVWGRDENVKMLEHRKKACGDDGGGASATLGYVFGAYPWAEQNFFSTWLSSTGENIAWDWPAGAMLTNYIIWNWIAADPAPREFGYGDRPHTSNTLPTGQLYTHMANIRHLYSEAAPKAAALARHVQQIQPRQSYSSTWFIYPFLLSRMDNSPGPFFPENLPHARHFETMGQIFMRSGMGKNDTYCLFSCGGILTQHRHYDALNFVVYHRGFLALDSGTRYEEFENGQHLANYYAQTVAHNCVVIHQPGEPPAPYWGGNVLDNHGGQHKQLGSVVEAFETNPDYVYVAGDATACYQHGSVKGQPDLGEKCNLVTRQMLFLMPNHFIIFDRVETTDASYRKDWLLHTAYEPTISSRTIRADHGKGRMFCRTLLPDDAVLTPVGGPGKEFWAAGQNWDIVSKGLKPDSLALMGQWRIEVTPRTQRKQDVFLHVIQVGDQKLNAMDQASLLQADRMCGVRLTTHSGTWEVVFNTTGKLGGHIKRMGGPRNINTALASGVQPQVGIKAKPYASMTHESARRRIPKRELPEFWIGDMERLSQRLSSLKKAEVSTITQSPGGRPMQLVAFGRREQVRHQANFNSAIGGREPAAYMDKAARSKPVILFVGPVHGAEVEGLTGLVNLINIMETGHDLAGRNQTVLHALGRQCRLLIIPAGNPDGIARFEPRALFGMEADDLRFWGQGTWSDDTFCGWPESKRQHPMAGETVGFLGCYFNDEGVNPMHDEFFAPMGPEGPAILKVARDEGPDLAVSLHSHESAPALLRPAYLTQEIQQEVRSLAQSSYALLAERGLPSQKPFSVAPEGGPKPAPFNLTSAMYHTSGAVSFTFECPHGLTGERACRVDARQILDIQLTLYEAMMRHALGRKKGRS